MGLWCPEALKEAIHIGSLKGQSSVSGGNMEVYLLGNSLSGPGADGEEAAQGEEKGTLLLVWRLGSWLVRMPVRFGSRCSL